LSHAIVTTTSKVNDVSSPLLKEKILLAIFGVLLPLVALLVELQLRVIARGYFDPFPSNGHAMLFALIPLSNALVLISMSHIRNEHYAFLTLLNGMAAGIATTYALMFIPLIPIFFLWVFALGIGVLGLAPLISIFTTHHAGHIICKLARRDSVNFEPDHAKLLGHLFVVATVIAVELPSTLTRIHLGMYCDPSNPSAINDLNWLRENGNQDVLLRACYERSGKATDILGTMFEATHPPKLDLVRDAFYKVTGKAFNSVPIPADARATMQHAQITVDGKSVQDEFDVDTDIAGESVSSASRGLTAANESLNGSIERKNAIAHLHWSWAFRNTSKYKREARAKAQLPEGAVITKATYWYEGKSHEATVSTRKAARRTYRRSLVKEDHPLLISACGPDQVLIQSYPVLSNSIVKIELELVAPLRVDSAETGALELPSFSEQNFGTTGNRFGHVVGVASNYIPGNDGSSVLPCEIKIEDLQEQIAVGSKTFLVSQTVEHVQKTLPKHTIIVIDGSAPLNQIKSELFEGLRQKPKELESQIFVVTDAVSSANQQKIEPGFEGVNFLGGQDNSFFLYNQLCDAAKKDDTVVLWIHGSQPVAQRAKDIKYLLLGANHPILYDLQICTGPNETLDGIFWASGLKRVPKFGSVKSDLQAIFSELTQTGEQLIVNRKLSEDKPGTDEVKTDSYDSVVAIAAAKQIAQDIRIADYISDAKYIDEKLATALNIVTPVTSAIVSLHLKPAWRLRPAHDYFSVSRFAQSIHPPNLNVNLNANFYVQKALEAQVAQLNNLSSAAAGYPDFEGNRQISPGHSQDAASPSASDGQQGELGQVVAKKSSVQADDAAQLQGDEARSMQADEAKSVQADEAKSVQAEETKPVPEPETIPMLILVMGILGAILFITHRRRKAFVNG